MAAGTVDAVRECRRIIMDDPRNEARRAGFTFGQLLLGMIAGGAAGAATALLMAPRSGAQTRDDLRRLAETSRERVNRLPTAVVEASHAAAEAFTEVLEKPDGTRA
jgi:gas vesicle protein